MTPSDRLLALETLARDTYGTDDIEIDPLPDATHISEGPAGIWVRAWVHLANDDLATAKIDNPAAE